MLCVKRQYIGSVTIQFEHQRIEPGFLYCDLGTFLQSSYCYQFPSVLRCVYTFHIFKNKKQQTNEGGYEPNSRKEVVFMLCPL